MVWFKLLTTLSVFDGYFEYFSHLSWVNMTTSLSVVFPPCCIKLWWRLSRNVVWDWFIELWSRPCVCWRSERQHDLKSMGTVMFFCPCASAQHRVAAWGAPSAAAVITAAWRPARKSHRWRFTAAVYTVLSALTSSSSSLSSSLLTSIRCLRSAATTHRPLCSGTSPVQLF